MANHQTFQFSLENDLAKVLREQSRTRGLPHWIATDPRLIRGQIEKAEKQKRSRTRQSFPPCKHPLTGNPWERLRSPLTNQILSMWFDHHLEIKLRVFHKISQDWVLRDEWAVPGQGFGEAIKKNPRAFHETDEGWFSMGRMGYADARLVFPWIVV